MRQLFSLLKAAMSEDMDLFRSRTSDQSKRTKIFLPLALGLIVMAVIGYYAYTIAEILAPLDLTYIMLSLFIVIPAVLTLIEGIYKSQGILFEAKDNDLLFSLPISRTKILFVRLFKLIAFQFLYSSLFILPALIVYLIFENPAPSFYFVSFIMLILAPIIPTLLASVLGYLVKSVSSHFKNKNLLQIVLTSLVFLGILYLSFNLENILTDLATHAASINGLITKLYFPAGLYINLIQHFDLWHFLLLIIASLVPTLIFLYLASLFYFKIISRSDNDGKNPRHFLSRRKHTSTQLMFRPKSQLASLVQKEFRRFCASPTLIINSGFGLLIIVIMTIALTLGFNSAATDLIAVRDTPISLDELTAALPSIFYGLIIFTACMTSITSSLISLEGKSFSITKSLPVTPRQILLAKILMSNLISVPIFLVCDLIFCCAFPVSILQILSLLLASIIFPTFAALVGLLTNLKYPKLNAASDIEVVKQSVSAVVSVFIGLAACVLAIAFIILGSRINLTLAILVELIIFAAIDYILWHILATRGVRTWQKLNY